VVGANSEIAAGTLTIAAGSTLMAAARFREMSSTMVTSLLGASVGIGPLRIDGNYTQTDTGRLNLEIVVWRPEQAMTS